MPPIRAHANGLCKFPTTPQGKVPLPMPATPENPDLDALLARRAFGEVLQRTQTSLRRNPRDLRAWHAQARAAFALGRLTVADEAIERAIRLNGASHDLALLRAIIDHRLGRSDAAIDRLRGLIAKGAPNTVDATMALAEVLHRAGRRQELQTLVSSGGNWLSDPRAQIFTARVTALTDPTGTADRLEAFARSDAVAMARRIAGFDAVRMLDAAGEYRRAFALAEHLHATTGEPFDVDGVIADANAQSALLARGKPWFTPRAPAVNGVALVVGMPRSGTTLLEQMLDRHSAVTGIGEYDGINTLGTAVISAGAWPTGLAMLPTDEALAMQQNYLSGIASMRRGNTQWMFDKSLNTWHWLPAVAAVMPGAVCFHIMREPRDTAVSLFLSNFHPKNVGWTSSLESIRRIIAAERALVPQALHTLGIPHESIVYEELVADPRGHMERCLKRMGLAMEETVLAPEANARTVLTLSHEQVRKPINRSSIGRWKNYEWAFGAEWD